MRNERAKENKWRHPDRNDSAWIVCLFEDEVIAGFNRATEMFVDQADDPARRREQEDEPFVSFADVRRKREGDEQ